MKKIVILAAFVLGIAMTHQALACDWMHHEASSAQTASACSGNDCAAAPTDQATDQATAACGGNDCASPAAAAPQPVDEPAPSAPTTVALQSR